MGLIYIFMLGVLGCNYTKLKGNDVDMNQQFNLPDEKISELSFALMAQKIFVPKCVSCHGASGNISLETYADVTRKLDLIKKSVFIEKTMPKKGSLSDEERSYLWNWIKMGAPEQQQGGGNPLPELEPLIATYESINRHVFQTSCKECHNPAGTGKNVGLDKESLMNSPLELIIPENPDESGLVIALERSDDKRMPPEKEGYSALKDEVKVIIRKWIENGAKD